MNPTEVYALCALGVVLTLFLANKVAPHAIAVAKSLFVFSVRTIGFRYLVKRHRLLGPWTIASVVAHTVCLAGNITCLTYGVKTWLQAAGRAGTMGLINMGPAFLAPHLSFLADLFGVRLETCKRAHRFCGLLAAGHVLFHGVVLAANMPEADRHMRAYALTGTVLMPSIVTLSMPCLRKWAYEPYLRIHQILAVGIAFTTVNHLRSIEGYNWTPLCSFGGIVVALALTYVGSTLYRNKKWGYPWPRIVVNLNHGVVLATIKLSRPVNIEPGQYLNLWVPSVSLLSSHPFVIASWFPGPQTSLDLVIEQRRGFTRQLRRRAVVESAQHMSSRSIFSGPHGRSAQVLAYDCVLLFATGFGIVPMLPYLQKLWHGYKERKGYTKRIHLVWQGRTIHLRQALGPIINSILDEDRIEKSYILYISVYTETEMQSEGSQHGRYILYPGKADIQSIIDNEAAGNVVSTLTKLPVIQEEHTQPVSNNGNLGPAHSLSFLNKEKSSLSSRGATERTLVLVSAEGCVRDSLRRAVRKYSHKGFDLEELDYQPD